MIGASTRNTERNAWLTESFKVTSSHEKSSQFIPRYWQPVQIQERMAKRCKPVAFYTHSRIDTSLMFQGILGLGFGDAVEDYHAKAKDLVWGHLSCIRWTIIHTFRQLRRDRKQETWTRRSHKTHWRNHLYCTWQPTIVQLIGLVDDRRYQRLVWRILWRRAKLFRYR